MTITPTRATPREAAAAGPSRRRSVRPDRAVSALVVVIVAILAVLVLYPLYSVLRTAISGEGWAVFSRLFSTSSNRRVLLNTLVLGVVVGVIGTIVGFFLAFLQVKVEMRGKKILHLLALMPIIAPPFAVATSAIVLFGRNGFISEGLFGLTWNIYGLPGLTLVLSLSFFPVAYMNLVGMLRSLDPALDEAASNLGASKPRIFWTVTLPMLVPGLAASFLLLFIESIADLANPLVIGGDYTVLAARAYIAIVGDYNIEAGAAYSLTLLIPALLVFVLQRYWVSRKSVVTVTGKPNGRPSLITGPVARRVLAGIGWAFGALVVLVYGTVLAGGFVKSLGIDNTFTLENYRYVLFGLGKKAMVDTTTLALIATPVAGLLGILIAWLVARKLKSSAGVVDFIGMLGLTVPGTVLGIGYLLAFNHPMTIFGVQILPALAGGGAMFSGAIAIIMVYVARSIPAGQRNGIASLEQIGPEIDEASTSLGASGPQTLRKVTLPLIRPATVSGLTYAFARSMTTLSPIIFITTPGVKIMTAQILAEVDVGRYGNAFAYCTILIVLVMMVIGLLNLLVRDPAKVLANLGGS